MPAVIGSAIVVLAASVIAGRALLRAFGRDRPTWLQGGIGFALLVVLAPLLIRLPGRATTATIIVALLLLAALAVMRRGFFAPSGGPGEGDPPSSPLLATGAHAPPARSEARQEGRGRPPSLSVPRHPPGVNK